MNEQRFAKNATELARAFGLPLSPRKKKASLAEVALWIAAKDFPKKKRYGWDLKEVGAWVDGKAKQPTAKGGKSGQRVRTEISGIAPGSSSFAPPDDEKQGGLFESEAERFNRLLDLYEDMLFNPVRHLPEKILVWQVNLLRQHRGHLFESEKENLEDEGSQGKAAALPHQDQVSTDLCDTFTALAQRLDLHYRAADGSSKLKYQLGKQEIADWRHGKRLNGAPPPPGTNGVKRQHSLRAWIEWFDRYFLAEWKLEELKELPGVGHGASLRQMQETAEREKLEFERWERQVALGKFISVEVAGRLARGEARQLAEYWRTRNEQTMIAASKEKLLALLRDDALTVEIKAQIHTDWLAAEHRKFTDDVEGKAAAAAEKHAALLKAEVEKDMGR